MNGRLSILLAMLIAGAVSADVRAAVPVIRETQPVLQAFDNTPRLSSGTWVQIFGADFSTVTRGWAASDFNGPSAPTTLEGVSVRINGKPAYVSYVSPTQVNVQAPDDDAVDVDVPVVVSNRDGVSNTVLVRKSRATPALLTAPQFQLAGRQYAAAFHSDLATFASRPDLPQIPLSLPASPGDVLVIYAVGCGPTNPPSPAGQIVTAANPVTGAAQTVLTAGTAQTAITVRAFMEPNYVGLCRFDITVPDVKGDAAGDVRVDASVGPSGTVQPLYLNVQSSQLSRTLTAAFRDYAAIGAAYAQLHKKSLGVTQPPPPAIGAAAWIPLAQVTPGSSLDRVLSSRVLRFGFVPEYPLHDVSPTGEHSGFDYELAVELARRIGLNFGITLAIEWVPLNITLPVGPTREPALISALTTGMRNGQFDAAFESTLITTASIAYARPVLGMFPGIVYTRRDNLDVSSIADRPSLVRFLIAHPGLTFVHGAGKEVFDALAADAAAGGGNIVDITTAGGPSPSTAPHFRMADINGLTKLVHDNPAAGILLDVNPRLDFQPEAPFTLPD